MPLSEFWHGEMRLLSKYQIAYLRKADYEAWRNGMYTHMGISIAIENALRKKGTKAVQYPIWRDPIAKSSNIKITKENLEEVFRKEQIENNNWLRIFINKNKGVENGV